MNKVIQIKSKYGLALLNAHPDKGYLGEPKNLLIYEEFLRNLRKIEGFWNPLPRELARWWLERITFDLDGKWEVILPEEAVWAYLEIEDDRLSIDLKPRPSPSVI